MRGLSERKVLIVGGKGVLGTLTATAFRQAGWTVRSAARGVGPWQATVDLDRPETLVAAMEPDELVVNTVPHPGLSAERIVLEHGGTLINTSALPAAAARSMRAIAGAARGTVLMSAGIAPGVTNVVAADLLREHPGAEELEIVFTLSEATARGPADAEFVQRGLTAMPRHRTAVIHLPAPFGKRQCLGFGEGEAAWLGGSVEGRVVRLYICLAEPAAHERLLELNQRGVMHELPGSLFKSRPLPVTGIPSADPVAHWIAVKTRERRLAVRTVECTDGFLHAARSTVVFAEELMRRHRQGGCFDPEEICTLAEIEPKLRAVGVTIVDRSGLNC
jgi:hypothetical protein